MVILHTFLALAAGFFVLVMLGMMLSALVERTVPGWKGAEGEPLSRVAPGFAFVNLGSSFLAAAGGGYVTAWAASGNALVQVLALGIVVLALAALSVLQSRGKQPIWFQLSQVAISPVGVLAGGLVRLRVVGIL
ncbi:MAG: hypothetical protein ABSE51_11565 [Terracidiphilus sp.]